MDYLISILVLQTRPYFLNPIIRPGKLRSHMRHLPSTLSLLLLAGCNTVIDERYESLQEAQQAGVVERRWLPDIVPASAHDIKIRGDTEVQVLAGELFVAEKDFDRLVARLEPYSGEPLGADQHLASFLHAKKIEGLESGVYYQNEVMWVLVCNRARMYCSFQKTGEILPKR